MKSLGEDPHALDVVGKPKDLQLIWCRDQVGDAQGRSREVEHRLERFEHETLSPDESRVIGAHGSVCSNVAPLILCEETFPLFSLDREWRADPQDRVIARVRRFLF